MKKLLLTIGLLLLIFTIGSSAAFADGNAFTPYRVVCNGESLDTGYEYHNNIYISLDDFLEYGDSSALTIDQSKYQIYFDPADLDLTIADSETTAFIQANAGTVHVSMRTIGSSYYVPLKLLTQIAHLDYELSGEKISLYPGSSTKELMRINQKCTAAGSLLSSGGKSYTLSEGQLCTVKKEYTAFSLVELLGGDSVYVMSDCISELTEEDQTPDFLYEAKTPEAYDRQINIAWDSNPITPADVSDGVDVISPFEWFYQMVEKDGTLGNNANIGYADSAHEMGMEVWATITNAFTTSGSSKYTTTVLADEGLRNKTVAQYLFYAALYNVDGLLVDYEDMNTKGADKAGFTAFIETLSEYTHKMGIRLGVATLVPEKWNFTLYDYERLGQLADYIVVMSYDQHARLKDGAGSTSSKSWYTRNIRTLKEYVSAEKIIMGVPLFSFVTRYNSSGELAVAAKWGLRATLNALAKAKEDGRIVTGPTWMEEDGQYYVRYQDSGGVYVNELWMEDERSVLVRIQTAQEEEIAGTACWAIGHVDASFFELFRRVYRDGEVPSDMILALEE